jgi:hypothetical protein
MVDQTACYVFSHRKLDLTMALKTIQSYTSMQLRESEEADEDDIARTLHALLDTCLNHRSKMSALALGLRPLRVVLIPAWMPSELILRYDSDHGAIWCVTVEARFRLYYLGPDREVESVRHFVRTKSKLVYCYNVDVSVRLVWLDLMSGEHAGDLNVSRHVSMRCIVPCFRNQELTDDLLLFNHHNPSCSQILATGSSSEQEVPLWLPQFKATETVYVFSSADMLVFAAYSAREPEVQILKFNWEGVLLSRASWQLPVRFSNGHVIDSVGYISGQLYVIAYGFTLSFHPTITHICVRIETGEEVAACEGNAVSLKFGEACLYRCETVGDAFDEDYHELVSWFNPKTDTFSTPRKLLDVV